MPPAADTTVPGALARESACASGHHRRARSFRRRSRQGRRSCKSRSSCPHRWGRVGRSLLRFPRTATHRVRQCVTCSVCSAWRPKACWPVPSLGSLRLQRRVGLKRDGIAGFLRRVLALLGILGVLAVFRLRQKYAADAGTQRGFAGGGWLAVRAAFGFIDVGLRVIQDVVAAKLVAGSLQQRTIEQLDDALGAVVDDALCEAFIVIVGAVALFSKADRIASRSRRYRIIRILMELDPVGVDRERPLGNDNVADQIADLGIGVTAERVTLKVDRLVTIRPLREGGGDMTDEHA